VIWKLSLRLQSEALSFDELAAIGRLPGSNAIRKGDPVSSRRPESGVRTHSSWSWSPRAREDDETIEESLAQVEEALLGMGSFDPNLVDCDVIVAMDGRSTGSWVQFPPSLLRAASRVGAGIAIDAYCTEHDNDAP
jgi:hypothetical protein